MIRCFARRIAVSARAGSATAASSRSARPLAFPSPGARNDNPPRAPYRRSVRAFSANGKPFEFEKEADETLDSLCERFEDIVDSTASLSEADVSLSNGVLNVQLPDVGTYVINKQAPNRQIWLSSPKSGPARFDFVQDRQCWVYTRTGQSLHELLDREIVRDLLEMGDSSGFSSNCYLGGGPR